MKSALVFSKTEKSAAAISDLLCIEGFDDVVFAFAPEQLEYYVQTKDFDLILVNIVSELEKGVSVAVNAAQITRACVIIIVQEDIAASISDAMACKGVLVIGKPVNKHLFHHYLLFTDFFKRRMLGLFEENSKLKQRMEGIKIIDRAKMLLMQNLVFSEDQAHKYLERQAMDMRMTKVDVARQVLKTYDN
ncbi:MAG: ANTAR domain-containing protein [Oscillospiraceae bacterium]|jgi:response regulator NasT|nr:ANTAR domain-containing protein [Oscillospiraceae bacterium]